MRGPNENVYDGVVWWYERPASHSQSGAFKRGDGPMVREWACAPYDPETRTNTRIVLLDRALSGFKSREDAARAVVDAAIVVSLSRLDSEKGGAR